MDIYFIVCLYCSYKYIFVLSNTFKNSWIKFKTSNNLSANYLSGKTFNLKSIFAFFIHLEDLWWFTIDHCLRNVNCVCVPFILEFEKYTELVFCVYVYLKNSHQKFSFCYSVLKLINLLLNTLYFLTIWGWATGIRWRYTCIWWRK